MRRFLPSSLMLENYYTFLLMYPKILSKIKFVNFRDIIIVILVICVCRNEEKGSALLLSHALNRVALAEIA